MSGSDEGMYLKERYAEDERRKKQGGTSEEFSLGSELTALKTTYVVMGTSSIKGSLTALSEMRGSVSFTRKSPNKRRASYFHTPVKLCSILHE